ncbi:MAG: CoA-binding protein [Paracoccaceae bacterium]
MSAQEDDVIRSILATPRTVAVIGWSPNPARASHYVAAFLAEKLGMRVLPVNPGQAGQDYGVEKVAAGLADLADGDQVEMLDIFRRSDAVGEIVDEALQVLPNLKFIWMQLGVTDEAAARRAREKGIVVIQNRCPKIEAARLALV